VPDTAHFWQTTAVVKPDTTKSSVAFYLVLVVERGVACERRGGVWSLEVAYFQMAFFPGRSREGNVGREEIIKIR
jgi:hypothetical protein